VKLTKLHNAWKSFVMGLADNKLINGIVVVLTKLLTIIDKATSGFEGLGSSISKLGLIFTVFKTGQILYNKFANGLVEKFRNAGRSAGQAFAEEVKAAINTATD
jgi:hypothetical protein